LIVRAGALLLLLATAVACTEDPPRQPETAPSPTASVTTSPSIDPADPPSRYARIACSLPRDEIQRVYNGTNPERSGELQFVPEEPNYVGNFSSHSGPWDYLQEVPLFLYGPGIVPPVGEIPTRATVADLAPTYAEMIDFDFDAPDGQPLSEVVADFSAAHPKLILTVVWDGGGINVLERYPRSWPYVKGLIPDGAWYRNATVGSSPSVTPAIHSTIGTGAFPRTHGIVDLRFRIEGAVDPSAFQRATLMQGPSLGDVYDVALDNEPVIGMVGAEGTLGMIGHGSLWEGGDFDIAAASRAGEWGLAGNNNEFYEFPEYVHDLPGYDKVPGEADRDDGTVDGAWFGAALDTPDSYTYTEAYNRYQTGVIEEVIEREGFGADEITDLLYVNYKQIDKVGHKFAFPSQPMERAVEGSDNAFAALVEMLNRDVGEGEWVMALTADHGSTPLPETTGAVIIDNFELARDLLAEFDGDDDDRPVIQSPRVTQTWVDREELEEHGHTLEDMADYLMAYTRADNADDPSSVPTAEADDRVFAASFPSAELDTLPCLEPAT
jgi:Type I phosphodiesterase / nucleotide pyrophosphatase